MTVGTQKYVLNSGRRVGSLLDLSASVSKLGFLPCFPGAPQCFLQAVQKDIIDNANPTGDTGL